MGEFPDPGSVSSVLCEARKMSAPGVALLMLLGTSSSVGNHPQDAFVDCLIEDAEVSALGPSRFLGLEESDLSERRRRNRETARLLRSFLDEDSSDENLGTELDRILRENPFRLPG